MARRIGAFVLTVLLCLSMITGGSADSETNQYILYLLEQGYYDMAIHVIEGLRDGKVDAQPQQAAPAAFDQVVELAPESNGADWIFHMDVVNESAFTLTLQAVLIRDYLDDTELATYGFEGQDLNRLPMGQLVLEPGNGVGWDDAYPVTTDFNRREYLHVFTTEQGEKYRISLMFDMRGMKADGQGAAPQPAGDWSFPVMLQNTGDTPWRLVGLDIINLMSGEVRDTFVFEGAELDRIGLGGLVLEPGQMLHWGDGHPATSNWNGREYRFRFLNENDQPEMLSFLFENLHEQNQPVDYAQDSGRDLKTLRHDAAFEVEVYDGVFWVPASALGGSRYTNAEIHGMLGASPEEKQGSIATLYEALQLYQVGGFTATDDNVRICEGGVNWEHHKPGYHAVRTNTGCCATDSNWLRYILDGDYEEVGYIATSQRDGSGHIYNYLLQDGWYYIIDLTHYHADGNAVMTAKESGNLNDYYASDYILGNVHKVQHIQAFVDYVQRDFNDPPGLMFLYTRDNCFAVDGARSQSGVQIIYEEDDAVEVHVIFDDPSDQLEFVRADAPKSIPDWNTLP